MTIIKEQILIAKIRKGDKEAYREIYKKYSDKIYRFILFRLPDKEDALDATQEVFLKLWDYIYNNPDKFIKNLTGLIYQIARNVVASFYYERSRKQQVMNVDINELEFKLKDETKDTPDENVDLKIKISELYQIISKIKNEEYRQVIELKYIDDLSHKEISKIINKSEGSVRVLLHRAIKKLKDNFEKND